MPSVLEEILGSNHYLLEDRSEFARLVRAWAEVETNKDVADLLRLAHGRLVENDPEASLRLLQSAQRLSPSHSIITLFIGDLRLILGRATAAEPFELLARRSDWRGAWFRLALTRLRAGDFAAAASELHEALSRNAPQTDKDFLVFATAVARLSGARGWCGLSNNGQLLIGGDAAELKPDALRLELDASAVLLQRRLLRRPQSVSHFRIDQRWFAGGTLDVRAGGIPLLGSPISIQSVGRIEGFVEPDKGGLAGWCWHPAEPDVRPTVTIMSTSPGAAQRDIQAEKTIDNEEDAFRLSLPRRFSLGIDEVLSFAGQVDVRGPHGRSLYGSPLNPLGPIQSGSIQTARIARRFPALGPAQILDGDIASEIGVPALHRGLRPHWQPPVQDRTILVVIPVYRGLETTLGCLASVLRHKSPGQDILVVSDASPEPKLIAELQDMADRNLISLLVETVNRGFPSTANIGLRQAAKNGQDVILLNSDTIVTDDWAASLQTAIYSEPDIGTATPFSNAATILSYPSVQSVNDIPDAEEADQLADLARRVNGAEIIEVPTGHGFCLYIRHECLIDAGVFREDVFAQGYGEENDFCMRARHLGWRHFAVPGVFIAHVEGQSFTTAKSNLTARNLLILNRLHPGYDHLIWDWQKADPLFPSRRRLDIARWIEQRGGRPSTLFVTHDRAGGVLKHVNGRAAEAEDRGRCGIICKPSEKRPGECSVDTVSGEFPNLRFDMHRERGVFQEFLDDAGIEKVEIHHLIGHEDEFLDLVTSQGWPYDVFIHDYSWFCPRITLTREKNRYCGEPAVSECVKCIRDHGSQLGRDISPEGLYERSARLLSAARRIVVPTSDTGRRVSNRFNVRPVVTPWEDESRLLNLKSIPRLTKSRLRRVCVTGAIGYEKGYDIILECARMISERNLPLEIVIVGFTCDDKRLLETGKVMITGRYDESEVVSLIKQQNADFGFLPALWPETWSYVLTQLWEAELSVVAFDIGAPSQRIKARSGGVVLPLGVSTKNILDLFLSLHTNSNQLDTSIPGSLPVRRVEGSGRNSTNVSAEPKGLGYVYEGAA